MEVLKHYTSPDEQTQMHDRALHSQGDLSHLLSNCV